MKRLQVLTITLALLCGAKASAQKWVYTNEELGYDSPRTKEAKPLRNGNIAVTYNTKSPSSSLGSYQPGLLLLSPDGEDLARNDFSKPALWGYHPYVLSDEDGTNYMMAAYSPDHDSTCANFFMNFDNPPDHSILGLYKLDEQLSIVESHEFQIPVDTMDSPYYGFGSHNEYCGNIFVFSAFIDEGAVVGGYIKKPSFDYYHPRGNDSIFFFRIGLDGTLHSQVGYEIDPDGEPGGGGLNWSLVMQGYNLLRVGDSYVCFLALYYLTGYGKETENNMYPGHAYFLDRDFNITDMKHYHQRSGLGDNYFYHGAYIVSRHNTVYMSSGYLRSPYGGTGCSLYEYGVGDDKTETLPILSYIERTQSSYDEVGWIRGVGVASDNSLYFAYSLWDGREGLTIEHLTPDFDTISTMRYNVSKDIEDAAYSYVQSIEVTETDDLLMTFLSLNSDGTRHWNTVAKFPAESFENIKEAHTNNLKVDATYPNPAKGQVTVTGENLKSAEVTNALGQRVATAKGEGNRMTIDIAHLPTGLYFVSITDEQGRKCVRKVVKE